MTGWLDAALGKAYPKCRDVVLQPAFVAALVAFLLQAKANPLDLLGLFSVAGMLDLFVISVKSLAVAFVAFILAFAGSTIAYRSGIFGDEDE